MVKCLSSCQLFGRFAGEYLAGWEYPEDELAKEYPHHFRRVRAETVEEPEETESGKKKQSGGKKR